MLFALVVGLVASGLETLINGATGTPDGPLILSSVASLVTLLPSLAVTWRRLHDIGRSGLWYPGLAIAIPLGIGLAGTGLGMLTAPLQSGLMATAMQLFVLACIAGSMILLFVWLTRPSQIGPNQYGPNPHEVSP